MIITFEGIEGSGKSFHIKNVAKYLLDIKENFYKGEELSEEETLKIMRDSLREDATFNIVGEKATELALEAGVIKKEGIKEIAGIPFALVLM